jgi:hypothetical protein
MTVHASQGKTRPFNVVHLNSCFTHIQEFHEHEILDDITRLRYEGNLPDGINGDLHNSIIHQYQQWKGTDHVPGQIDAALRWSSNDPLTLLSVISDSNWQIADKSKGKMKIDASTKINSAFVPAKGSIPVALQKHKLDETMSTSSKKQKTLQVTSDEANCDAPLGLKWDQNNWSCAYDSLFVILYDIWMHNPKIWTRRFKAIGNTYLDALSHGFHQVLHEQLSFENLRDSIRVNLHNMNPVAFPVGQVGASVAELTTYMLQTDSTVTSSQLVCPQCEYEGPEVNDTLGFVFHAGQSVCKSTSKWLRTLQHQTYEQCSECSTKLIKPVSYISAPTLLIMEYHGQDIKTSPSLKLDMDGKLIILDLRGIIYHGAYHFTSRIIGQDATIWYHDGQNTGSTCIDDGQLDSILDNSLRTCKERDLVLAVYAQK